MFVYNYGAYNYNLIARLNKIKSNVYSYNATLYRACANANPHNMNEAMIGISNEVSPVHMYVCNCNKPVDVCIRTYMTCYVYM